MQLRRTAARKIALDENAWFRAYKNLAKDQPYHVLLESGRDGKYSIIGLNPFALLEGKDGKLSITEDGGIQELKGNPLELMREWMQKFNKEQIPEYPEFQGGAIGFLSYDYARYIEKLPSLSDDDLKTPDLYFLVFDEVFVYDHQDKALWIILNTDENDSSIEQKLDTHEKMWNAGYEEFEHPFVPVKEKGEKSVSMTEEQFIDAVEKLQAYIAQGDVFQVNLSVRQSQPVRSAPFKIYESLREVNPSPYMSYMQAPDFQIVSGSPELLIKKKGLEASTRPIAGTRSRGMTDAEDLALANELIGNEKERAEHVMLVDLERNDLGRVCKFGTVEVNEFMVIEKYSHVMHIVSNVRGEISEGKDAYDLIEATFPGGTITGAPKVRTMEIIEELEPVRRGIYTGSIGWIGFSGDMELNIAIRTMIVKDGVAHIQAGAGVVIDSNPKYEYKESLKKAAALWKAKELSEAETEKVLK